MSYLFFVFVALVLFAIGAVTVLMHRSAVIALMGVEMMLNATNLVLITFSKLHANVDGEIMAFFVMTVAAAEVVIGLALIVTLFRSRRSTAIDDHSLMKN